MLLLSLLHPIDEVRQWVSEELAGLSMGKHCLFKVDFDYLDPYKAFTKSLLDFILGELVVQFSFLYAEDAETELESPAPVPLLSITPLDSTSGSLSFVYAPDSGRVRAIWGGHTATDAYLPYATLDWTMVTLTLKPSTNEMQMLVVSDGEYVEGVSTTISGPQENQGSKFGIQLGPLSTLTRSTTTFLQINEEKGLKRTRRQTVLGETERKISAVRFENSGYVSYDFFNRIREVTGNEEISIDFIIPKGVQEGLLWLAEGSNSKSFIFIRVSFY